MLTMLKGAVAFVVDPEASMLFAPGVSVREARQRGITVVSTTDGLGRKGYLTTCYCGRQTHGSTIECAHCKYGDTDAGRAGDARMPVSNHGFETWMRVIADEMPPGDADAMRAAADQLEAFRAFRQWMEAEAGSDPSLGSMTAAEWLAAFDAERSRRASPRLMVDAR